MHIWKYRIKVNLDFNQNYRTENNKGATSSKTASRTETTKFKHEICIVFILSCSCQIAALMIKLN